ncbi:hypothetical protein CC80DRAFT_541989 [Byssothecium circinans]|uniref:Protein kinase domain-containing protein n=1 Tax=Byssothecium circinans TaxID=147558 RepID=A0A6A5UD53_9PLEO|nr:hypothetical protein CC80DRAFT_541989 [Byssothecium circinans]
MTKPRTTAVHLHLARPLATAYLLGLLSSTGPRVLKVLLLFGKRKLALSAAWLQLVSLFRQALSIHRFPFFCASLVGGSTLLHLPVREILLRFVRLRTPTITSTQLHATTLLAKFLAAFISASFSFKLLNGGPQRSSSRPSQPSSHLQFLKPGPFDEPPELDPQELDDATLSARSLSRADLAGRTMDLTLFTVIRALDVLVSRTWEYLPLKPTSKLRRLSHATPPLLFCFSAATIMHAWFYSPSRLPHSYNTWISSAARLDHRLLLALRHARYGTWVYGQDTGMASLLGSMCHDYGLPEERGDPAVTIPIPCEVVHMGCGKSCEKHALVRFWRGWCFAAKIHAPIQLFVLARHVKRNARSGDRLAGLTRSVVAKALVDMSRGSAFLGAFIALFYYGVCLSRTRLGPKVFSYKTVTPQMWDSGLCVLGGSLLCGGSIFVEQARKRMEILLFVLPRAAATWFPRRYLPENQWKEHAAFALSAAILLTAARESPGRIALMVHNASQGAARSRLYGLPVLQIPAPTYRKQVNEPGSCSAVWRSDNSTTVLKAPLAFHLDGCDDAVTMEYENFQQESVELLEREKEIYRHLGEHKGILPCLQITDDGLVFPYLKNSNLRHFLKNSDSPITQPQRLDWVKSALISIDFIHSKGVLQADISTRNFLVADDLSIVLCDFSGSTIHQKKNMVRPETRYEKVEGTQPLAISVATAVFCCRESRL